MNKPIERKYNIYKKDKSNNTNKNNNIITKVPNNPVMLSKEDIFNKIKNLILSQKANDSYIAEVINKLNSMGINNFVVKTGKQIHIKTDENRVKLLQRLAESFGGKYIDKPSGISSAGYVELDNGIKLVAKPNKTHSAGILNEKILVDHINKLCAKGPINIRFIGENKTFECIGVKNCKATGTDVTNRRKADLVLQGIKDYPISLKKDNAEIWESADQFAGAKAKKIIDKLVKENKVELELTDKGVYKIKPNVAFYPTTEEKRDLVFGSDILPNGAVIEKTFSGDEIYTMNDDSWFEIPVTYIITSLNDVEGHRDVVFLIRNDSSRNSKHIGYPGLRVLAVFEKRLNKNVLIYKGDVD